MKLSNIQKSIIKDLSRANNGLNLYTFWIRYKLTPNMLLVYLNRLLINNLANISESRVTLTDKGISWIYKNRHIIYSSSNKAWLMIPKEFEAPIIPVNKPYLPYLNKLHNSIIQQN
jgi:hypothetical protein